MAVALRSLLGTRSGARDEPPATHARAQIAKPPDERRKRPNVGQQRRCSALHERAKGFHARPDARSARTTRRRGGYCFSILPRDTTSFCASAVSASTVTEKPSAVFATLARAPFGTSGQDSISGTWCPNAALRAR